MRGVRTGVFWFNGQFKPSVKAVKSYGGREVLAGVKRLVPVRVALEGKNLFQHGNTEL